MFIGSSSTAKSFANEQKESWITGGPLPTIGVVGISTSKASSEDIEDDSHVLGYCLSLRSMILRYFGTQFPPHKTTPNKQNKKRHG